MACSCSVNRLGGTVGEAGVEPFLEIAFRDMVPSFWWKNRACTRAGCDNLGGWHYLSNLSNELKKDRLIERFSCIRDIAIGPRNWSLNRRI